jgi:putative transcriptional regulator
MVKLDKLIEFRQGAGLGKYDMAKLLDISESFYEKIESGERNPSYNFISRFSRKFPESDINAIFFNKDNYKMCEETANEEVF